jgi:hypothetical protein
VNMLLEQLYGIVRLANLRSRRGGDTSGIDLVLSLKSADLRTRSSVALSAYARRLSYPIQVLC